MQLLPGPMQEKLEKLSEELHAIFAEVNRLVTVKAEQQEASKDEAAVAAEQAEGKADVPMSAAGAGPGSELDDEETTRSILKEAEAAGLPAGATAEELRNYVTFAKVAAKRGCGRPAPYGG